jgi:predicted cobalt transporter CbtA
MPLRDAILDAVFRKLGTVYGKRFLAQYEGMPPAAIRQDWAFELATVSEHCIEHALSNLPQHPPNVVQFRSIALGAPKLKGAPRPTEKREVTPMPEAVKAKLDEVRKRLTTRRTH